MLSWANISARLDVNTLRNSCCSAFGSLLSVITLLLPTIFDFGFTIGDPRRHAKKREGDQNRRHLVTLPPRPDTRINSSPCHVQAGATGDHRDLMSAGAGWQAWGGTRARCAARHEKVRLSRFGCCTSF